MCMFGLSVSEPCSLELQGFFFFSFYFFFDNMAWSSNAVFLNFPPCLLNYCDLCFWMFAWLGSGLSTLYNRQTHTGVWTARPSGNPPSFKWDLCRCIPVHACHFEWPDLWPRNRIWPHSLAERDDAHVYMCVPARQSNCSTNFCDIVAMWRGRAPLMQWRNLKQNNEKKKKTIKKDTCLSVWRKRSTDSKKTIYIICTSKKKKFAFTRFW